MPRPGETMVGGRRRTAGRTAIYGLLALGVVAILGFVVLRGAPGGGQDGTSPGPGGDPAAAGVAVADAFLDAWAAEDWERLQSLTVDQGLDAAEVHRQADAILGISEATYTPGAPTVDADGEVQVPFDARWELEGLGEVSFSSTLSVRQPQREAAPGASAAPTPRGGYAVDWWYSVVHPDLNPDRRFQRVREYPPRAPILDAAGEPIVTSGEQVVIGVQPQRVTEPEQLAEALAAATDVAPGEVMALLARDDLEPAGFYEVAELPRAAFEQIRADLYPVPGISFRARTTREGDVPESLDRYLGRLGEVTEELLGELDGEYGPGDVVGTSGLERAFEERLSGKPAQEALITESAGIVDSLVYIEGAAPAPVETTFDLELQRAAERAVQGVEQPVALVAVDHATGAVRAAVSAPNDEFDRALAGQYPPGSTFKIVTAAAALEAGARLESRVACPPALRLGDRDLRNAGGIGPGEISFIEAFAVSCNTAFAQIGIDAEAQGLAAAAERFGFGVDYGAGVSMRGGGFPLPESGPELGRAAIGQSRVTVSPMHMASVAGAVASGAWRAPHVVADARLPEPIPMDQATRAALTEMMRAVVTGGTAASAGLPEGAAGKTGTAEFDRGDGELGNHAWFAGWRGPLAVAVVVEDGGGGGSVAAPIAARFLAEAAELQAGQPEG